MIEGSDSDGDSNGGSDSNSDIDSDSDSYEQFLKSQTATRFLVPMNSPCESFSVPLLGHLFKFRGRRFSRR